MVQTEYLTVGETAARLGVTERTVLNMIDRGSLPGSFKLDPSAIRSPYRVPVAAVVAIEQQRQGGGHGE